MLKDSKAFSGFSVDDLDKAKEFYGKTLGLGVMENPQGLVLKITGDKGVFIYSKDDHKPATYTMLNFSVSNIEKEVSELAAKGVKFEQYDWGGGAKTDDKGIMHGLAAGQGPDIAWFKDPAGNVLAVLQEE